MAYRTTPKMADRKRAHREHLLEVATRIFGRRGYHAATVPMIVAAAGSSVGSFYFYFRNKEDVFAATLAAIGESLSSELNRAIAAAGGDTFSQMKAAIAGLVGFLAEHPDAARILIVESSGLGKRLEAVRRGVIASHTRSVARALATLDRPMPGAEAAVVASCWVGAVHAAVQHWLEQPPDKRLPPAKLAKTIIEFNLRGIGAPPRVFKG